MTRMSFIIKFIETVVSDVKTWMIELPHWIFGHPLPILAAVSVAGALVSIGYAISARRSK